MLIFGRYFVVAYSKIRRTSDMTIWLILIGIMVLSWIVSLVLKSKFTKYSQIPVDNGMSGRDVAERMLKDFGIYDVTVQSVEGQLTDHYNPANKTVNLSQEVYSGRSISSAAVAAHECGHAVQHAKAYAWLGFRSNLVPVVSFASRWVQWLLLAGILLIKVFPAILLAGIVLFALTTLFSFITLPVEIDASRRALAWLSDALKWAAYTYVIAALGSLATLLYYIAIFAGGRRN